MQLDELKETHKDYKKNINAWNLYGMAYEGGLPFIKHCLKINSRESLTNWKARQEEGVNFNFASSIIDLLNFYLTEKQPVRYLGGLDTDPLWQMFLQDCDYNAMNYDTFINETNKFASVYGYVGIMVSKSSVAFDTKQQEIDKGAYPYLTMYIPCNILDWKFRKNEIGRPVLTYLKLREPDDKYLLYFEDNWILYEITPENVVMQIDSGENTLGEIPFLWSFNIRNASNQLAGISDIKEVAPIVASICRNISSGDEIIKFAGFPMLRLPKEREGAISSGGDVLVAPDGVLEFDPELGDKGKPDWLESKVLEPIEAILGWTDRKADEIFRLSHLSGVHGQRKSNNEVASGLALRYEGQQLNSLLNKKANQMCETELLIIRLWLLWQNKVELMKTVKIIRSREFATDDLTISLDLNLKAIQNINSKVFNLKVKEKIVKQTLPDLTDQEYDSIKNEIDNSYEVDQDVTEVKEVKQNQKTPNASDILNRRKGLTGE